ncbi:MAG TPA: DsbA family oxidoreductase [Vicinamibacterales bacterium]|jgi:predicted DsbA family dithiol-disulfide isomerase|nr:DsbA family oxidoreductase [Vicinamibacterales bacterium]
MRVDVWSDPVCPWCYIGKRRFEHALAQFDGRDRVELVHHSFQLNPAATPGVTSSRREMLMRKYRLSPQQVDDMDARMTATAAADGLEYHLDGTVTGNTFDAHQLLHLARERDVQDALLERLYRAYFTERRSLFDAPSLLPLVDDVGLDRGEAEAALRDRRYADAVAADIDAARRLGVTGVPFFVIDNRFALSGAQPPETFLAALNQAAGTHAHARPAS